jgi:hypothetical protein
VGSLTLFVICGLLGVAVAMVGLHLYLIATALERSDILGHGPLLANELVDMLWDVGALVGLALIVFLMSQRLDARDPSPSPSMIDTSA